MLERRNEPDALDQLLVIATPKSVLAVLALAGVLAVAIGWSVIARIPVKVDGQGLLLRPGMVSQLQATSEGRLISLLVGAGDRVRAGDAVAVLAQPSLERELDRLNAQFDIARAFAERQVALVRRTRDLESGLAKERRETAEEQLAALEDLRKRSTEQRELALADRREKLANIEGLLARQRDEQQARMDGVTGLFERGVASRDTQLAALSAVTASAIETAQVELQISDTRLSELDATQQELQLLREIQDLQAELTRIDIGEQQAERGFADLVREQEQAVEEVAAQIRSARQELAAARRIDSPYDGVILELVVAEGQLAEVGAPVAMMRIDPQTPFLRVSLSADARRGEFQVAVNGATTDPLPPEADGATVAAALARLPAFAGATLRGEGRLDAGPVDVRYGVAEAAPELEVEIRDRSLHTIDGRPATGSARILGVDAPERPLSHVGFFPIGLAKQISAGLEIRIDPSSVEQERFGSLVGAVTSVSEFAATEEGMLRIVGNSQVAKALAGAGGVIMVEASLNRDESDPSGFEWTSKSPAFQITEGTTTIARVVVEQRRPITFVIPLLRRWLLGDGGEPSAAQIAQGVRS